MMLFATLGDPFFGLVLGIAPQIIQAPRSMIMPIIFVLCTVGSFSIASRLFDVWVMLAIGVLGFVLRKLGYPMAPLVLGLVLGDIVEKPAARARALRRRRSRRSSPGRSARPLPRFVLLIVLSYLKSLEARVRIALCNEVIAPMPFPQQCEYAAKLGYDGLEIALYTLSDEPHRLGSAQIAAARVAAEDAGVAVTGLHWLLLKPTVCRSAAKTRMSGSAPST